MNLLLKTKTAERLFTLALLLLTALPARSQDEGTNLFRGIISAGPVLAQIDGDGPAGYDYLGYRVGFGTFFFVKKRWLSTGLEFHYASRGSRTAFYEFASGEAGSFRFSADYVEVPLLLNFHDKDRLMVRAGVMPAFPVRSNLDFETVQGAKVEGPPACLTNDLARFDLSLVAGVYFIMKKRIGVGVNYSRSLTSARPYCLGDTRTTGQYHKVINAGVIYLLGMGK